MASTQPKLSICLITYNRAQFLDQVLQDLLMPGFFDFTFEIVLCDNHSTDNTPEVVEKWMQHHPQIRYYRQKKNVGPLNNLLHAYRSAKGEFAVYLADDDRLISEGVANTIQFMDAHPDIVACHAPWEMWDNVKQASHGLFYQIPEPRLFSKSDARALFNMVINHHIFPEICIYRTAFMHRMMTMPCKAYWAFVHLAHALDLGTVAFLPRPYYRSVIEHSIARDRPQEGHMEVVTGLDGYRAGLEYLAQKAFRHTGLEGIPADRVVVVQEMIQSFINARVTVAIRILKSNNNFRGAYEYLVRQQANGLLSSAEAQLEREHLRVCAGMHSVVDIVESMSSIEDIILYNIEGSNQLQMLLRALRPTLPVRTVTSTEIPRVAHPEQCLVLTESASQRNPLLDEGFLPGLVIVLSDLMSLFTL